MSEVTAPPRGPAHEATARPSVVVRMQYVILAVIIAAFALTSGSAMRHTSTTFDEILLPAAGARGYGTGDFSLVNRYHPPVLPYVYGLPLAAIRVQLPEEQGNERERGQSFRYARELFFDSGNDPERLAFLARCVGVIVGSLLVFVTFLFTRGAAGPGPALLAAALIAFVPDVLGHSGISYNDVPLALVVLLATWAGHAALRDPRPLRAVAAGAALGLALGVKFSAIALGPVAVLLLAAEIVHRWPQRSWLLHVLRLMPVVLLTAYLMLVAIYLGDFALSEFRAGLSFNIAHAKGGHGAPAVLLGRYSATGWWYFFPVAFFLKTSVGLHALMLVACGGAFVAGRGSVRAAVGSDLRVPVLTGLVFLTFLVTASLNIGFRHALPLLPLISILVACGVARVWRHRRGAVRAIIVAAVAWHIISPLRQYPHFIAYLSEYTGPREYSYETLVDSSLDWGQGLIELRRFMEQENVTRVLLSYFGSAVPEAYGVDYIPLPSFFELPGRALPAGESTPRWLVVSATNMSGNYLTGDPFARFREIRPTHVLAGSLFVFYLEGE
jgi:hypothetical protein